jgi:hypothetical protein
MGLSLQKTKRVRKPKKSYEYGDLEQPIEREILTWLKSQRIMAWKVKTTATYDTRRGFWRKIPWYYRTGVWDIHGFIGRIPFIIEVKSRTGKLSQEQIEFEQDWVANAPCGSIHIVARSLQDVEEGFATHK